MAGGLERALDKHPEWPPAAAQFRALCLNKQTDAQGNELISRGGMYNHDRMEEIIEYDQNNRVKSVTKVKKINALENDQIKERRDITAAKTLNRLTGMFADEELIKQGDFLK